MIHIIVLRMLISTKCCGKISRIWEKSFDWNLQELVDNHICCSGSYDKDSRPLSCSTYASIYSWQTWYLS